MPHIGQFVVYCMEPYRTWCPALIVERDGQRTLELLAGAVFTTREEVEVEVFRRRWERYFGSPAPELTAGGSTPSRIYGRG
jgi:hypothetical protein